MAKEKRYITYESRLYQRRKRALYKLIKRATVAVLSLIVVVFGVIFFKNNSQAQGEGAANIETLNEDERSLRNATRETVISDDIEVPDWIIQDFIPLNYYSRPGTALVQVNAVVVHYTGNPGTTAEQNRNFFASLAETGETSVSSHFVIGIDGTVIQCIPLDEIAYASNDRNNDTISIECCHEDETGKFSQATFNSLIKLTKWLMEEYNLDTSEVIRHYDVNGKECPYYYVSNDDKWREFKSKLK